jgi:predicted DNA-binding protein
MIEFRDATTIRQNALNDPVSIRAIVERAFSERLAKAARAHNTTSSEIIRIAVEKFLDEIESKSKPPHLPRWS